MKRALIYLMWLSAYSYGCSRSAEPDGRDDKPLRNPNAYLSTLHEGGYGVGRVLDEDFVFEGYVTATDISGNFFRTFVIQDATGAIEINAGFGPLHNIYSPGRRIIIYAEGLAVLGVEGVIRLGTHIEPYSLYRVEPFGTPVIMAKYVFPDTVHTVIAPKIMSVGDLTAELCGQLVRIDGLKAEQVEAGLTWADPGGEGSSPAEGVRHFYDHAGNHIAVVTSGYADFAGEVMHSGVISLSGILVYGKFDIGGGECFGLKMRDINDAVY